jgi:hypothetical protein
MGRSLRQVTHERAAVLRVGKIDPPEGLWDGEKEPPEGLVTHYHNWLNGIALSIISV